MTAPNAPATTPQEWVFVPIPPTEEMTDAAERAQLRHMVEDRKRGGHDPELSAKAVFKAMALAAPKHPNAPSSTIWLTEAGRAYGRVSDEQIEVVLAGALHDVCERSGLGRADNEEPYVESEIDKPSILELAASIFDFKLHKQSPEDLEKYLRFASEVAQLCKNGK